MVKAREVGYSALIISELGACAIARFARSVFILVIDLGFRFAPPQGGVPSRAARLGCETLCFHPLRGFWKR
jgi:hypothetical protein